MKKKQYPVYNHFKSALPASALLLGTFLWCALPFAEALAQDHPHTRVVHAVLESITIVSHVPH